MNKRSEYTKKWRNSIKEKMVKCLGGKCICCGYNRCQNALDFHHLDPSQKEFALSYMISNVNKNYEKIIIELKKCVLICANCHRELHANIRTLPDILPIFKDYLTPTKEKIKPKSCVICNKVTNNIYAKYCSTTCRGVACRKIDWETIDLQKLLETQSIADISKNFNVSWNCVKKRIKKLGIKYTSIYHRTLNREDDGD